MATTPNRDYELQTTGSNRGRWGVFINNILSQIDNNISGLVEIDCAGSADITISSDEAENIYQKMTGILTGDIEVIYPDKGSFFFIENATTGNFSLKVVNVALGTGVVIAQGDVALVYTDSASNKVVLIDNGISTTIATLKDEIKTVYVPTVGGTANAITLTPITAIASYSDGQRFRFIIGATNTAAVVNVNVSGLGNIPIKKTIGGALVNLAVGDLPIGTIADIEKIGSSFQLLNIRPHSHGADVASAATIDLDAATGDYVYITGTTAITAVTLAEGKRVLCKFTGIVTITNGASLICPASTNIVTVADQIVEFIGEAAGVVRVLSFASSVQGAKADSALQSGTQAEIEAQTSGKGVDGGNAKYHPGVAKAWGNFTTITTTALRSSYGVSSVTDNGTGTTTVNLQDTMSTANYCVNVSASQSATASSIGLMAKVDNMTTTSFRIKTGGDGTNLATLTDNDLVMFSVLGDLA